MTRLLSEHFDEVRQAIVGARRILLLLDFDGTLAPIVERPEMAKLSRETLSLLARLNREPRATTAIISGRALFDLKQRVGMNLIYAGNHGLEIEGHGLNFEHPSLPHARPVIGRLASDLADALGPIDGVFVENKGLSLSIHYRRTDDSRIAEVVRVVESARAPYAYWVDLRYGKKVLEVRPKVQWDKGKAALWILRHLGDEGVLPVCMGDDATDEDIFQSLPISISIKVGDEPTAARYRVPGPDEVFAILQRICAWIE